MGSGDFFLSFSFGLESIGDRKLLSHRVYKKMLNMLNMHCNTVKIGQISGTNQRKIKFLKKRKRAEEEKRGNEKLLLFDKYQI